MSGRPPQLQLRVEMLREYMPEAITECVELGARGRLRQTAGVLCPSSRRTVRNFYEAFYSNHIEGSKLTVDEAWQVVQNRLYEPTTEEKLLDTKDMRALEQLVNANRPSVSTCRCYDDWRGAVRQAHGELLPHRPHVKPGQWKDRPNWAGQIKFILPPQVEQMMGEVYAWSQQVPPGVGRAAVLFVGLISVHPFLDGNGRITRLVMNEVLVASGGGRIVVHDASLDRIVDAMHQFYFGAGLKALLFELIEQQQWTNSVLWDSKDRVRDELIAAGHLTEFRRFD